MGFTESLHPLSIDDGIRAAARRTPGRTAVVEPDGTSLSYSALIAAAEQAGATHAHPSPVVRWLSAMMADTSREENRTAATVEGVAISHRTILLRAFDRIVAHAAFDRDGNLAVALPLSSAPALVAATISLWLGGTLHLLRPGDVAPLVRGIADGRFDTCWANFDGLEGEPLPKPAEGFVLAVCNANPSARLVDWLGASRVTQ